MKYTFCMLFFCFLFVGCSDDSTNNPVDNSGEVRGNLIPLSIYNYWVYRYESYRGGVLVQSRLDTLRFDSTVTVQNNTWFGAKDRKFADHFYQNRDTGFWEYDGSGTSIWFKYPVETGQTWMSYSGTIRCELHNEYLQVPAGTFSGCVRYRQSDVYAYSIHKIKPGVGILYQEQADSATGVCIKSVYRLSDYHVIP
ncbi:MAG: hypothetical protein OEM52_08390 [bacterium]|nr:hypothetical protein [bacterium]